MFKKIRKLVAEGELFEAIESLQKLSHDPKYADELISYMARYNDLIKQIRSDTLSYEEISINKNKLTQSLLTLLNEVESVESFSPNKQRRLLKQWEKRPGMMAIPLFIVLLLAIWFISNRRANDGKIEINNIENSTNSGIIKDVSSQQGVTINFELKDTLNADTNQASGK